MGLAGPPSTAQNVAMLAIEKWAIGTSDVVRRNLLEAGEGRSVLLLPRRPQTAAMFRFQLHGLARPAWTEAIRWDRGYFLDAQEAMQNIDALMGDEAEAFSAGFVI